MINVSYGLEIEYEIDKLMEIEHIDFSYVVNGIITIPELKTIDYTAIYLVTTVKDQQGNILKRSQCKIY